MQFPLPPGTFFVPDPNDPPRPPDQVEVRDVRVQPLPDGRRIRVFVDLTPFQQRPHVEIEVYNQQDQIVAWLSVVEPISPQLEFTLHLRDPNLDQTFRLVVSVQYPPPNYRPQAPEEGQEWEFPQMREVHRHEYPFQVPPSSPFDD